MKPNEELGRTKTGDGRELVLLQHADDYFIELDGQGLMSTRAPGSERALAELVCSDLADTARPRVLIGGLGLGFTLGAALDALGPDATVVVAEVFATVVDWNRKYCFEGTQDRLADPRVCVEVRDVVDVLRTVKTPYDAVLLDVDNGPDAWCLESNRRLYDDAGLERIRTALRPGGRLGVWSSDPSPRFVRRLVRAGFQTETTPVRSRGRKGERHTLFIGRTAR